MVVRAERLAVRGLVMRYLRAGSGSGAPLVLLHGGSWGERAEASWSTVLDQLASERDVIAPDWLGFGGSDKVRDFAAPEERMLDQLASLLTQLGLGAVDMVALSMGGSLVLRDQCGDRPRLSIRRLVLVSAGGPPMTTKARQALFSYDGSREGMRSMLSLVHHAPSFAQDEANVDRWHAWSLEPGVYEAFAAAALHAPQAVPPTRPDLSRLRMPTLVCAGAHDRLKEPGWEQGFTAALPAGESTVFDASGHLPQVEEPAAFVARVLRFLDASRTSNSSQGER